MFLALMLLCPSMRLFKRAIRYSSLVGASNYFAVVAISLGSRHWAASPSVYWETGGERVFRRSRSIFAEKRVPILRFWHKFAVVNDF